MRSVVAGVAVCLAAGCSNTPVAPGGTGPTAFSFAGRGAVAGSVATPTRATADTLRAGYDEIVITSARIALRQVFIGRSGGIDCSAAPGDDRCRPLLTRELVVALPLGSMAEERLALPVPEGAYAQVALETIASAQLGGQSVRVEGTFNGAPFVYVADVAIARALALPRPLLVGWTGHPTNVTVSIPVTSWFRGARGLLDPRLAQKDGTIDAQLRAAIARSLSAFEDRDRDGNESNG